VSVAVQKLVVGLAGTVLRMQVKVGGRGHGRVKVCGPPEDVTSNLSWLTCAFVIQSTNL
jgi:hypothetical protein